MMTNAIMTGILALVIVGFIFYRQMMQRVVSQRNLLLPALLAVLLGGIFLTNNPSIEAEMAVVIGALVGVLSGLASGQFMRVWRDDKTGVIYQQGSWRYLVAVLVFIALRVALRFVLQGAGHAIDDVTLNDAFIAAIVGNYLGRAARIALRALPLAGGNLGNLPGR
jgi:hypothetical protein